MDRLTRILVLTLVAIPFIAATSIAQSPSPRPSNDLPVIIDPDERPKSKSDATRVVGTVLEINRQAGTVKLQADEGVVTAKPHLELLRAARVGDTISVARPDDRIPSASPRTR